MYRVQLLDSAADDLRRLDRTIARRLLRRIEWLAENLEVVNRERLTGQFAGLLKFRVGDYRILYEVIDDEQLIIIHIVGHRRDIYHRR